jgi:hypothetical protein
MMAVFGHIASVSFKPTLSDDIHRKAIFFNPIQQYDQVLTIAVENKWPTACREGVSISADSLIRNDKQPRRYRCMPYLHSQSNNGPGSAGITAVFV